MITQWNLVFFDLFGQLGAGLCLYSQWRCRHGGTVPAAAWRCAAAAAAAALAAGCTLGFGSALVNAALAACLLLAVLCLAAPRSASFRTAACIAAAALVALQACAAVPGSIFSASGVFPFLIFPLFASATGASVSQLPRLGEPNDPAIRYGRFYLPLRFSLWMLLFLTAAAPCISWGDPLMNKSGFYWMQTQLYWMGVIFCGVAIGLSHMGRITLPLQAIVTLAAAFGILTGFYADGVHGAIDPSTLYLR